MSTEVDTSSVIDVLTNDSASEGSLDPTTVTLVTLPDNGSSDVDQDSGEITPRIIHEWPVK